MELDKNISSSEPDNFVLSRPRQYMRKYMIIQSAWNPIKRLGYHTLLSFLNAICSASIINHLIKLRRDKSPICNSSGQLQVWSWLTSCGWPLCLGSLVLLHPLQEWRTSIWTLPAYLWVLYENTSIILYSALGFVLRVFICSPKVLWLAVVYYQVSHGAYQFFMLP